MKFLGKQINGDRRTGNNLLMTDSGIDLRLGFDHAEFDGGESTLDVEKRLRTTHIFHKKESFFGYFSHSILEKTLFYSVTILGLVLIFSAILWGMIM